MTVTFLPGRSGPDYSWSSPCTSLHLLLGDLAEFEKHLHKGSLLGCAVAGGKLYFMVGLSLRSVFLPWYEPPGFFLLIRNFINHPSLPALVPEE